jgi:hypothetical protein
MKKAAVLAAVVLLSILFTLIGILLFFNRESRRLIRWKLKVGALLLTLNGMTLTGCLRPPVVTCYDVMPLNWLTLDNQQYDSEAGLYQVELPPDNTVRGDLSQAYGTSFSWLLCTETGTVLQKGSLVMADGALDSTDEDFLLTLTRPEPGRYRLWFFNLPLTDIPEGNPDQETLNQNIQSCIITVTE